MNRPASEQSVKDANMRIDLMEKRLTAVENAFKRALAAGRKKKKAS